MYSLLSVKICTCSSAVTNIKENYLFLALKQFAVVFRRASFL